MKTEQRSLRQSRTGRRGEPQVAAPRPIRRRPVVVFTAAVAIAVGTMSAAGWYAGSRPTTAEEFVLAYVSGEGNHRTVLVARLDGSDPRTVSPPGVSSFAPAWAPDGHRLAYVTTTEDASKFAIRVHDVESTTERVLLETDDALAGLAWSPDGSALLINRITRTAEAGVAAHRLERVSSSDGRSRAVLRTSAEGFGQISWRDASTKTIAVAEQAGADTNIVFLDDEGKQRRLHPGLSPAWSPDGQQIAFTRDAENGWELVVADASGSAETVVFASASLIFKPGWGPDGQLLFERYTGTTPAIWAIDAGGGDPVAVIDTDQFSGYPTIAVEAER